MSFFILEIVWELMENSRASVVSAAPDGVRIYERVSLGVMSHLHLFVNEMVSSTSCIEMAVFPEYIRTLSLLYVALEPKTYPIGKLGS